MLAASNIPISHDISFSPASSTVEIVFNVLLSTSESIASATVSLNVAPNPAGRVVNPKQYSDGIKWSKR